ncbi:hydrophobic protein [Streptomyces sp. Q6]|uniref:Hydrophobic protein n=1 Tax=Streptomyces citrinus TaxID=3118173 RepID=A0ACD5A5Y8_9ACTN
MLAVVSVLLLALILFGTASVVKPLGRVALAVLVVWLLGFLMRGTTASGSRSRRYRW